MHIWYITAFESIADDGINDMGRQAMTAMDEKMGMLEGVKLVHGEIRHGRDHHRVLYRQEK